MSVTTIVFVVSCATKGDFTNVETATLAVIDQNSKNKLFEYGIAVKANTHHLLLAT